MRSAAPALLFGVRLWVSVCLALYLAFWLELDNAYWAGTTAAIVCQPSLGASLRKGWFRMVGTLVGAVVIVLLTASFPQDRALFLTGLALWGGACAFAATLLGNFAAYSAALAGYTAAIIAGDQLGATGGVNGEVFILAVTRVSEIAIGIVSASIVLAGTDLGSARRRLAALFAGLAAGIATCFTRTLALAGRDLPDTQSVRRDFLRRVVALDPVIDEALGESSQIRYHSPLLQRAVDGFFEALSAWRALANHLVRLPDDQARAEAAAILRCLPQDLRSLLQRSDPRHGLADPGLLHQTCEMVAQRLILLPAGSPSLRLLADKASEVLTGMSQALKGTALLIGEPGLPLVRRRHYVLRLPDWLPALVNAGRAFLTIGVVALFWIITAWPSGVGAITWAAIATIQFAPRADQAAAVASRFTVGSGLAAVFAAIMAFAVLPQLETFAGFSLVIGAYLVPAGALVAQPWQSPLFVPMVGIFVRLLAPANPMSYDPGQFYNNALALVAGCAAGAAAFRLLRPLSPAFRTRRLLALTVRDLRRLALGRRFDDWEGHGHGRLSAMPEEATPLQRAQLLAALSLGSEIIRLRHLAHRLDLGTRLEPALAAVARGESAAAILDFARLDAALAARPGTGRETQDVLRTRGCILAMSEVLRQHATYFDAGAPR
jgi:uncharacterized membrane protein YccC